MSRCHFGIGGDFEDGISKVLLEQGKVFIQCDLHRGSVAWKDLSGIKHSMRLPHRASPSYLGHEFLLFDRIELASSLEMFA